MQDANGQPLIFSIGTDKRFSLLRSTSGDTSSGYTTIDLLEGFHDYASALAFAVSQDMTGLISVAVALLNKKSNAVDVFFIDRVSNDDGKTDFTKLSAEAFKVGGIDHNSVIETARLGTSDDTQRLLLVLSGKIGSQRFFYQLQANAANASKMEFPENLNPDQNQFLSLSMGFNFGQRANYFLYEIGETQSLVVITIPDQSLGSIVYDYSPGNINLPEAFRFLKYNNIATSTARPSSEYASSDLYITADTGIYRIPNGKATFMEQVTDTIKNPHELIATATADSVSLWIAASPSFLYYIYGKRMDSGHMAWNQPIQFASGVLHVAPMKRVGSNANELFTLNQDMSITHYWQDPETTNWQSKTAVVKGSSFVVNEKS